MCGIYGIVSQDSVTSLLVDGLARLEYRGYDSCGIAVLNKSKDLEIRKGKGEVAHVRQEFSLDELSGNTGLGHTRWATHGNVSDHNSHPHSDSREEIAIVHNGIVENHEELRNGLKAKGYSFRSSTDSEIIALLIEDHFKSTDDFELALKFTWEQLKGSFAIGVISSHCPEVLYAMRQESPLIIGQGPGFCCFASDPLAFASEDVKVAYVEDGDLVKIDAQGFCVRKVDSSALVRRPLQQIDFAGGKIELGEHPDYMSKEIAENGNVTRAALKIDKTEILKLAQMIETADQTIITGMGTAYYVGVMAQYTFSKYAGIYFPTISADEMPYLVNFTDKDHILAVSQSGETYDTLKAMREAKSKGAKTSAVLNVGTSSMAREMDFHIDQKAGPEICVLSTKATISQLVVLQRVALELGKRNGFLAEPLYQQAQSELERLPVLFDQLSQRAPGKLRDLARQFSVIRNWFFLGRGNYYGLALEAALKFKEVTYCHAEGMPAGFLKHGTISLIDEAMHTAIFLPGEQEEELRTQTLGAVAEIRARLGAVIAFQPDTANCEFSDQHGFNAVIDYPDNGPLTNPLLALMQAQRFAYYTARALGRNVDKPRALAKSVTVG